jgi:type VI secretion system secreted protein Hcp
MAALDCFLRLDDIEGESQDAQHKGEVDLDMFSWGLQQFGTHATGGGGGAGKVHVQDFHFLMKVNKATPKLFLACASGQHIKQAVLTCRKAGGQQQEYVKVTMHDLLVSACRLGGSGDSDLIPMNDIQLNFAKIEFEYKEQKADGTLAAAVKAGWDVKQNKAV